MSFEIQQGDCLELLRGMDAESVQCCVTSPPYWGLRDYGHPGQLGLERAPELYVARLVEIMREVRRVLRDDGTLWLNLGDCYNAGRNGGHAGGTAALNAGRNLEEIYQHRSGVNAPGLKPKDLVGIPWRVAFALQADGWWLRQDIIWAKPNPMPESVTDRCTKAHEYVFMLSKSAHYFYDAAAIAEAAIHSGRVVEYDGSQKVSQDGYSTNNRRAPGNPGGSQRVVVGEKRNRRDVWAIATQPFPEAHFATMPEALVEPCILAGSKPGDLVLDPFAGSGTVGVVALRHGRSFVGCELNPEYAAMAKRRIAGPLFAEDGH